MIAVETRIQMVEKAQQIVAGLDIGNVAVVKSRLQDGYPSEAPYQGIIIEGGVEYVPQALLISCQMVDIWYPSCAPEAWMLGERRYGSSEMAMLPLGAYSQRRCLY